MTYEPNDSRVMKKSSAYEVKYTHTFEKKIQNMDKSRIEKAIVRLAQNPFHNTEFAKGIWRGKRKYRVGDLRIMFVVCDECYRKGHQRFNQCEDCSPKKLIFIADLITGHEYQR